MIALDFKLWGIFWILAQGKEAQAKHSGLTEFEKTEMGIWGD